MTSLFQHALGTDYSRLQPELQQRFSMSSVDGEAQIGHGVMTEMNRGALATLPVLALGRARRLELPGHGADVPFDLMNFAYVDTMGRETFGYSRRFRIGDRVNRFDDTMIYSEKRKSIINYLGSHQDIAAELALEVTPAGDLRMIGGDQRIYLGQFGVKLPRLLAAQAEVIEHWDEAEQHFTISVEITAKTGRLFGYRGWFVVERKPMSASEIPDGIKPDVERAGD